MTLLSYVFGWIRKLRRRRPPAPVCAWFRVACGDDGVRLDVAPPGGEPWRASIKWTSITRVCFEAKGLWVLRVYVSTSDRSERYEIPSEADGFAVLWTELERRGIIGHDFAALAMAAEKGVHCWPPSAAPDGRP